MLEWCLFSRACHWFQIISEARQCQCSPRLWKFCSPQTSKDESAPHTPPHPSFQRRPLCSVPSHPPPSSAPMAPCPQVSQHHWVQRMQEWTDALFSISLMRAGATNKTGSRMHRRRKLCQREPDMQTALDTVSPQAMGIPEKMPQMVATMLGWCLLSLCAD